MGDNGKKRFIIELHSSYFLHPSEGHGVLIIAAGFDGHNYDLWERAVITALRAKNKLGFINGSLERPTNKVMNSFWKAKRGTWSTRCFAHGCSISLTQNSE